MSVRIVLTEKGEEVAAAISEAANEIIEEGRLYPKNDDYLPSTKDWVLANDVLLILGGYYDEFERSGETTLFIMREVLDPEDGYARITDRQRRQILDKLVANGFLEVLVTQEVTMDELEVLLRKRRIDHTVDEICNDPKLADMLFELTALALGRPCNGDDDDEFFAKANAIAQETAEALLP